MTDDTDLPPITRYVFGECDADEARALGDWIDADPARREAAESLRQIRDAAQASPSRAEWDADAGWRRLTMARRRAAVSPAFRPIAHRRPAWLRPVAGLAAALAIAAGAPLVWRSLTSLPAVRPVAMREATTSRGERAIFTLSDGSHVTLGVESRIRFARTFGPGPRDVFLEGEAYFEVASDTARPFVVHSGDAVTRVLGTRFAVRDYAGEDRVQVVVAEGRVSLGAAADSGQGRAVLTRGMLGRLAKDGETTVLQNVDVADYLGWTTGRLTFHDTPLGEVARDLARWYDLDVQVADSSLDQLLITASFADERLDDVLHVIASSLDVRYQRIGRTVRFLPKRPSAPRR